jgi:hypothetical protein
MDMKPRTNATVTPDGICQCPTCKEVFSTTGNFDRHRKGTYEPNERHCVDPSSVGLIIGENKTGTFWQGKPPIKSPF